MSKETYLLKPINLSSVLNDKVTVALKKMIVVKIYSLEEVRGEQNSNHLWVCFGTKNCFLE